MGNEALSLFLMSFCAMEITFSGDTVFSVGENKERLHGLSYVSSNLILGFASKILLIRISSQISRSLFQKGERMY